VLFFVFSLNVRGQTTINFPAGSRAAAMGNAYVMESDVWSVYHNQAGLGFYPHFAIGFHHENKFVVKEYALHALGVTMPTKPGTFGLSYRYFGYSKYNISKIGLGFGRQFGNGFAAGIQMNLHHLYQEGEFGNRNALTVEGGIQYKPADNLVIGAHVFNPTRSKISPYDQDTIQTSFSIGAGYRPFDKFFMALETQKILGFNLSFKGGLEYEIYDNLFIRGGLSTEPFETTFGLGYLINKISVDIAFTHTEILGFTPHFSIQIRFD
jgi:hypothetical protein